MIAAESRARERLAATLARDPVPLDEAALAIALEEYPALDVPAYLARLDALGARARSACGARPRAAAVLVAVRDVLAGEEGLRGNEADYEDPRNSFVNDVLDRGLGIPISLSVVYMEVARRAGLPLEGVGMPGHFLARYASPSGATVLVDGFRGGEMTSPEEWAERFRARSGRPFDPRWLEPVGARAILVRMLGNLERIYVKRRDDVRAWSALDRMLVVVPGLVRALRDRGLAAARLGAVSAAERDLAGYLAQAPEAEDAAEVRAALERLRRGGGPRAS
jgi:regulator of sirC expression with transglutaminase-like and TPR domain